MADGFFDMPAGYSDADVEMADLEDAGRRWQQRYGRRGLTFEDVQRMRDGAMVTVSCKRKDTGERYDALMIPTDTDDLGPCDFRYSCDDGASWHETARAARAAGYGN